MTAPVLAFALSGHDNDSYMLGEETRRAQTAEEREFFDWRFIKNDGQHPATCSKCGRKIERRYVDPSFKLRKKSLDISSTYDGYTIVSDRFKGFLESLELDGIEFVSLPSQPKHHWLLVHNVIEIDQHLSTGIRFSNYCDLCESYGGVFGTSGLRLKEVKSPIAKGIYRTDLDFAQAHQQHPVIVVGTEVGQAIKVGKFKGVCLNTIVST